MHVEFIIALLSLPLTLSRYVSVLRFFFNPINFLSLSFMTQIFDFSPPLTFEAELLQYVDPIDDSEVTSEQLLSP